MPEMSFGRSIRYRRNKLGLSQTRLGELVGRSGAAIRSWERDASTPTDPSVLQALSAVLGIEQDVLFEKAGVDVPESETSPTVEEVLGSLTPREEERLERLPGETPFSDLDDDEWPDEDEAAGDAPLPAQQPVAVAVPAAPVAEVPATERPSPAFNTSEQRYLYTTPAPPLPEPTYMEDHSQRQLYRIRNLATLVLIVGLLVLFVWALGNSFDELIGWWDDFVSNLQL